MSTKKTITRQEVLAEMDIRFTPDGTRRIFSIKFMSLQGKVYFVPRGFACGAGRMNQKQQRKRGVQPCDCKGNPEGHVYPVDIDLIVEYNSQKVTM